MASLPSSSLFYMGASHTFGKMYLSVCSRICWGYQKVTWHWLFIFKPMHFLSCGSLKYKCKLVYNSINKCIKIFAEESEVMILLFLCMSEYCSVKRYSHCLLLLNGRGKNLPMNSWRENKNTFVHCAKTYTYQYAHSYFGSLSYILYINMHTYILG